MTRGGHNFVKMNLLSWKKMGFVNLESELPRAYNIHLKRYVPSNQVPVNVLVQRDLLNWLASYFQARINNKNKKPIDHRMDEFITTWGELTKEFFNETDYVPNKIPIIYDKFKSSKEYRQKICKEFGGKYNELKLNYIPHNGQHSSFDGKRFQNKGNKMQTELRYKQFIGTQYEANYLDFLRKHPNVVDLYLKYFDVDDNKLELIYKL